MRRSGAPSSAPGRTLDALQSAYRVGARVAWRAAAELRRGVAGLARAGRVRRGDLRLHRPPGGRRGVRLRARAVPARGVRADAPPRAGRRCCCAARRATRPRSSVAAEQAGWPLPAQLAVVALGDGDPLRVMHRMPVGTIGTTLERRRRPRRARPGRPGAAAAARGRPAPPARRARADGAVGARARVGAPRGDRLAAARGGPARRRRRWRAPTSTCSTSRWSPTTRLARDFVAARLAPLRGHEARGARPGDRDAARLARRARRRDRDRARAARPPAVGPLPARRPARGVRRRARRPGRAAGDRRRAARRRPARG